MLIFVQDEVLDFSVRKPVTCSAKVVVIDESGVHTVYHDHCLISVLTRYLFIEKTAEIYFSLCDFSEICSVNLEQ